MFRAIFIIPKKRWLSALGAVLVATLSAHALTPLHARVNRPRSLYWHGDSKERKIALTFDDGPNEPYTSEILKILDENHVHATFFMLGKNVETFPETARAVLRAGHVIGNHSYDHRDLLTKTNGQVRREILRTEQILEQVTGQRPFLFRPPYGDKDRLTLQQSRQLGYVMVEWSVSAEDWRKPGPDQIVKNVMKEIGNGAIILMHDGDKTRHGSDREQTVTAVREIITQLRQRGYAFVTAPDLLGLSEPPRPSAPRS